MPGKMFKKDESFGIIPINRSSDDEEYKILLIQHRSGHWSFPKGHKEEGESDIDTACRELEEETGIHEYRVNENIKFSENFYFIQNKVLINKTVKYFLGVVQNPHVTIQEKEVQDYAWLPLKDAKKKVTFKEGRKILGELKKKLAEEDRII